MNTTLKRVSGNGLICGFTLIGAALLAGCNNAGEGALSGGALGAGTGAIIGSMFGHAGTGAIVGAAGGALGGAVIGDQNQRHSQPVNYGNNPPPNW